MYFTGTYKDNVNFTGVKLFKLCTFRSFYYLNFNVKIFRLPYLKEFLFCLFEFSVRVQSFVYSTKRKKVKHHDTFGTWYLGVISTLVLLSPPSSIKIVSVVPWVLLPYKRYLFVVLNHETSLRCVSYYLYRESLMTKRVSLELSLDPFLVSETVN